MPPPDSQLPKFDLNLRLLYGNSALAWVLSGSFARYIHRYNARPPRHFSSALGRLAFHCNLVSRTALSTSCTTPTLELDSSSPPTIAAVNADASWGPTGDVVSHESFPGSTTQNVPELSHSRSPRANILMATSPVQCNPTVLTRSQQAPVNERRLIVAIDQHPLEAAAFRANPTATQRTIQHLLLPP
eukprot:CAMPEP_0184299584 /NCGR_PEP_ID=MMETSP1049-20130417/10165_1 /TAXON_ID=77928 /ORGANISM="Proteomonas sulcata, Strain CCMP704" /LENGTH=186 /DNA_ID=CAMNT_0026610061 /DNA_START=335 /DNA_END=895 /DNA_ORIENTATION=-